MKRTLALSILSFALLCSSALTSQAADLQVGDPAPDFSLIGTDGKTYRLSDFKGKQAVVLAWFPKAFTPGCTAECSALRQNPLNEGFKLELLGGRSFDVPVSAGSKLNEWDVTFFTASVDTPEMNKKFSDALHLDFPILSDPSKETATLYGVVNAERAVPFRWTYYIGKDGKILHIDKAVNPATHAQDMIAQFRNLNIPMKCSGK